MYAALSGVLFFFPLNLIQVQGYSATEAGAALLPFIVLMFLLSRWSGGLVERYGARRPLVVGPLVAAAGFALFARPGVGGSYWTTFFPAVVVLGVGMADQRGAADHDRDELRRRGLTPASLRASTTRSRVSAGLIAIAVLGVVLSAASIERSIGELSALNLPPAVRAEIDAQRRNLGAAETADTTGREAIQRSFVAGYRYVLWIAVALALASSASAAALIDRDRQRL